MKKIIELTTPIKAFAAMLFAGFICLYIVGGVLYSAFLDSSFDHTISFVHLLQGLVFSMLISLLWGICFSDVVIKKWRFFLRHLLFVLSLAILLALCFFMFSVISTEWSTLWLVVAGVMIAFAIVLSILSEWYFKKTGEHYTELLKLYQANHQLK